MNIDVLDKNGKKSSSLEASDETYGKVNEQLFYEVVKQQQAGKRSGTASTKTRSEVSGGGAKPWKQKGTGRARAGTSSSPIWRSGGTCFGPKPRDYSYKLPAKTVTAALKSAISYKIKEGKIKVFDSLDLATHKTKDLSALLAKNEIGGALIVADGENKNLELASRNIHGVKFLYSRGINVYDVLRYDTLVMTKAAFEQVDTRF